MIINLLNKEVMKVETLKALQENVLESFVTLLKKSLSYEELKALFTLFSIVDYLFVKLKKGEK